MKKTKMPLKLINLIKLLNNKTVPNFRQGCTVLKIIEAKVHLVHKETYEHKGVFLSFFYNSSDIHDSSKQLSCVGVLT